MWDPQLWLNSIVRHLTDPGRSIHSLEWEKRVTALSATSSTTRQGQCQQGSKREFHPLLWGGNGLLLV